MNSQLRTLWHLMRADYLERVRRHGFLVTLMVTVWFAYISLPPNHSKYVTMQIAGSRGIYNSAWVGLVASMMSSAFLAIAGFYVVKNTVERDRQTGVGQILATTPLSKPMYTLGKAASNFAVLATIALVVAVAAGGMQLIRGEDRHLDVVQLVAPFLFVTLPVLAVVAALAVLFETIPGLSGGLGNAAYFFLIIFGLFMPGVRALDRGEGGNDLLGNSMMMPGLFQAQAAAFPVPGRKRGTFSMGFNFRAEGAWDLRTFRWDGMAWDAGVLLKRSLWLGVAAGIALTAAIPFDRFDTSRRPARRRRKGRSVPPGEEHDSDDGAGSTVAAPALGAARGSPGAALSPYAATGQRATPARGASVAELSAPERASSPARLVAAELRLMLSGVPRVWWIVALGLMVAAVFTPLAIARGFILPFAWIWPLLLWSAMGAREHRHQTAALLRCSPHPLARQLPATWLAGAAITFALGAPVLVRLAIAGDVVGFATCVAGAAFVPSMALALGVWSGSGKLFEVTYLALWYMGPMNRVAFLDYVGVSSDSAAHGAWQGFAAAAVILGTLAVLGRRRQLRR